MSEFEGSSRDDRKKWESDDTLTPVSSLVRGEAPFSRGSLMRYAPGCMSNPGSHLQTAIRSDLF